MQIGEFVNIDGTVHIIWIRIFLHYCGLSNHAYKLLISQGERSIVQHFAKSAQI